MRKGTVGEGDGGTSVPLSLALWLCCGSSQEIQATGCGPFNAKCGLTRALAACLGVASLPYPLTLRSEVCTPGIHSAVLGIKESGSPGFELQVDPCLHSGPPQEIPVCDYP